MKGVVSGPPAPVAASASAPAANVAVAFRDVDILFGKRAPEALKLLDSGADRARILAETGAVLGVAGATLDVGEGEITVLMGLSGSGKSTLMRAVNGLNKPVRGSVVVTDENGPVDVVRCNPATLRRIRTRRVAMVFQSFALLPWRSVAENVGFGLELAGVPEAERRARIARQLELVGLTQWADKHAHELSGGMQQRVGLARAFATEAPILLMDEPFSALDPLIRTRLQDELLELQRQLKRTIVFVSHDLDEALKLGTRIAIMEAGRIVQYGAPQAIVLDPASDYVRDFVAHMNPLNVLRAGEVMQPLSARGEVSADAAGSISRGGRSVRLVPIEELAGFGPMPDALVAVRPDTPLRALIQARLTHGGPAIVRDAHGIRGMVADEDLFRCLVRLREGSGEGRH